jgi:putative PIN family toxin of toxin-antitoxin system
MKLKIVIDTNVLVAALKSRNGASFKLLDALQGEKYLPCLSVPLFVEYESVMKRLGLLPHLNEADIDAILDYLLSRSSIHQIFFLWRPFLKDPKDDLVLEAAFAAQCQYLVTFNLRDFQGVEESFGIKVLTPKEFLTERGLL